MIREMVASGEALPGEYYVTELDADNQIVRKFGPPEHPETADIDAVRERRAAERLDRAFDEAQAAVEELKALRADRVAS